MENLNEKENTLSINVNRNKSQSTQKLTPRGTNSAAKDKKQRAFSKGSNLPPIMAMTVSNFHHPIYYQTTALIGHRPNNNATLKKEKMEEDIESLRQELTSYRLDMNQKKSELNELRITISKLSEDNKSNKALIAKILGIDLEKSFTKKELINTIIQCKPTEAQKKQLREAYEVIKLKLEINGKKKILNTKNTEINNLTKNAKVKVIKELDYEYQLKCQHQKKIMKVIKKMENTIKKNEKAVYELEKEYNIQKENNKKLMENMEESEKKLKETEEKKEILNNELYEMKEKMRRLQEKISKEKNKMKNDNDDYYIRSTRHKIAEMNRYKENKDEIIKELEEKKNNYKKLEEQKKEQDKLISELNEKNKKLSDELDKFEEEKNKLMKKANEPRISNQKLKELENEIKALKEENEKYLNVIVDENAEGKNENDVNGGGGPEGKEIKESKIQKPQHISETEKEDIVKKKDIIAKNKIEQEQLNQQIEYLKNELEGVNAQITNNQNSINQIKKLMDEYFKSKEKEE